MISDTPAMNSSYSNYGSCGGQTQCSQLPTGCGSEDMYMNFMSYANNACMYMFTSEQADVMYATALSEGFTVNPPAKCEEPPEVPIAMFSFTSGSNLCEYGCISFTDESTNSPTAWSWAFNVISGDLVLDESTSTVSDPVICIINGTSGIVEAELIATNVSGSGNTSNNVATNIDNTCVDGCYTYTNLDLENDELRTYINFGGGYIAGSNNQNHESKAEYFDLIPEGLCYPFEITSIDIKVGEYSGSPTGTLNAIIWDNTGLDGNGNIGAPGNIISTTTINVSDIVTNVDNDELIHIDFTTAPVSINSPIYVGISGLNTTLTGGEIGLVSNTDLETSPATAWEEKSDGSWFPFDDSNSWGLEIAQFIIIDVLPDQPAASFMPASSTLCSDGTNYTFTNTSTLSCSGNTPIYEWTLRNSSGSILSTTNTIDAIISFTNSGTYSLELCVLVSGCEHDCTSMNIDVIGCGDCAFSMLTHPSLPLTESGIADYESSDWIESEAVILNGASVDYDAIQYVLLNPGFTVELGGVFSAIIDGCNNGGGGNNINDNNSAFFKDDSGEIIMKKDYCKQCGNLNKKYIQQLKSKLIEQIIYYSK